MGTIQETLQPTPTHRHAWINAYRAWLVFMDFVFATITITVSIIMRGISQAPLPYLEQLPYASLTFIFVPFWLLVLLIAHGYDKKVIGIGLQEYRRVVIGTFCFFGAVAIISYLLKASLSRSLFLIGLPLGIVLILMSRRICRQILTKMKSRGWVTPTLIVGHVDSVRSVLRRINETSWNGYQPAAVSLTDINESALDAFREKWPNLYIVSPEDLETPIEHGDIGAVIVAGGMSPGQIRALSWRLEDYDIDFLVTPVVADVAGPRMAVRAADGLSFVHMDLPEFKGAKLVAKRIFDIVFSALVLVIGSPIYAAVALTVKLGDGGPVIFRQERVGLNGTLFTMHKFRTMCVDAEAKLAALVAARGETDELFKMEDDPRITKAGKFLRRYSLDELPQFWDVFRGSMSVVGPRPALPREVAKYKDHQRRRFLVKPGITGPWQVGGRSSLTVDQYFRLDLDYVENWSMILDILMVFKTIRAVFEHRGAC